MNINSIINCMDDTPSKQSIDQKEKLNKEFKDKANIKGLVSYIYYPSQRSDMQGHSELEIEGNSYTLTNAAHVSDIVKELVSYIYYPFQRKDAQGHIQENRNIKPLSRMIEWTRKGFGLPFFRFNISVTPQQLYELREGVSTTNSIICSMGAAKALKQYANFKIPLPLTILPLTSAIYLAAAKKLGSQRVYQIEFYGSKKHPSEHLSEIIPGVAGESMGVLLGLVSVIQNGYYMYNLDTDTYAGFLSNRTIEFLYNNQ